jgi:DNA polymerase-1
MATLRQSLHELAGNAWFTRGPHLVFFMHDELVIHCPADAAPAVEQAARESAVQAGRLLFGALPVEFPLTIATVDNYAQAK